MRSIFISILSASIFLSAPAMSDAISQAIMDSLEQGRYEDLQAAIMLKPDLNYIDEQGRYPMLVAARVGHLPSIELLMLHGARLEAKFPRTRANASAAAKKAKEELQSPTTKRKMLFHRRSSNRELVKEPLNALPSPPSQRKRAKERKDSHPREKRRSQRQAFHKSYPLLEAIKGSHVEVVKFFIDYGNEKQIKQRDSDKNNALHYAAMAQSPQIMVTLLAGPQRIDTGRDPRLFRAKVQEGLSQFNKDGKTPLHLAVENQSTDFASIVTMLLELDAPVNSRVAKGDDLSPLDITVQRFLNCDEQQEDLFYALQRVAIELVYRGARIGKDTPYPIILREISKLSGNNQLPQLPLKKSPFEFLGERLFPNNEHYDPYLIIRPKNPDFDTYQVDRFYQQSELSLKSSQEE